MRFYSTALVMVAIVNDASYDAYNHNFLNLMLVGRWSALAGGDGGTDSTNHGVIPKVMARRYEWLAVPRRRRA